MNKPLVTINIVVFNGEKYLRHCLNAVRSQTYDNVQVNVFDNASTDSTREIVRQEFPEYKLIAHPENIGMWPGQEKALEYSHGDYIVALSVDVMLHSEFIEKALNFIERDPSIGAIQAKVYSYEYNQLADGKYTESRTIDTCGFQLKRSRRVTNIGHGQHDAVQFDDSREVFAVEGAVPFVRRSAFEDLRVGDSIIDKNYFWYGDDLDLTWRMRLFGWKQFYVPDAIAYHDRSTTKGHSRSVLDYLRRVSIRQQIPLKKRIWDWTNVRFTIVKNDYIINILKDLPFIAAREVQIIGYWLLFEPGMFKAIPRFFRLLPRMIRQRRLIMARAKASPNEIHRWFL